MRFFWRLFRWLLILLLLLISGVAFALFTEPGLRGLLTIAERTLPAGMLSYREVSGSLRNTLRLDGLRFDADELRVELEHSELHWRPAELLRGHLRVINLELAGLTLHLPPAPPEPDPEPTEPFALPDIRLPLAFTLQNLALYDVRVFPHETPEPLLVDALELAARGNAEQGLSVQHLRVRAPEGRANLAGSLLPIGDYPLQFELNWQLDTLPYGSLNGEGRIHGELADTVQLEHRLSGFIDAALDASASALLDGDPFWDGKLRLAIDDLGLLVPDAPELVGTPLNTELTTRGRLDDFSLDGELDTRFAPFGDIRARLRVNGSTRVLNIEQLQLDTSDTLMQLATTAAIDLDRQTIAAQGNWQDLVWPLTGPMAYASPQGRFELSGSLDDYRLELHSVLDGAELTPLNAELRARGNLERLWLDHVLITEQAATMRLELDGTVGFADLAFQARGRWEALRWPLQGEAQYQSPGGHFEADGTLDDYRFLLEATADGVDIPAGDWHLQGQGSAEAIERLDLHGKLLDGELTGRASARWQPQLSWQAELRGSTLNPGRHWPELPGELGFALSTEGRLIEQQLHALLDLRELSGQLTGYPLEGRLRTEIHDQDIDITILRLQAGEALIDASGRLGATWDLGFGIEVPQLANLLPEATGSVRSQGRLSGPRLQPRADIDLTLSDFALADNRIDRLRGEFNLDAGGEQASRVDLNGSNLLLGGQNWRTLRLSGSGIPERHELQLDLNGEPGNFGITLNGGLDDEFRWQGRLTRLDARDTPAGNWQLAQAVGLSAGADQARLAAPLCLTSQPSRLCLNGNWDATAGADSELTLEQLDLARFSALLPNTVTVDQTLSARLQATLDAAGRPNGQLQIDLDAGRATLDYHGQPIVLELGSSRLNTRLDNDRLDSELSIDLGTLGRITSSLRASELFTRPQLDGQFQASLEQFEIVSQLAPQLQEVQGHLDADLRIAGVLPTPDLSGNITLRDGALSLPETGTRIEAIELTASGDSAGVLNFSGQARSGSGGVTLDGRYRLGDESLNLTLQGEDFLVLDTFSQVIISPDVNVVMDTEQVRVTGEVAVPVANLAPPPRQRARVTASEDVVFVSAEAPDTTPGGRGIHARIRVILGNDVWVEAVGFRGQLRGDLLVEQTPQLAPRGSGALEVVAGDYTLYGQELAIERGRLLFSAGPIDNPGLDLRIARRFEGGEVLVGAQVLGSLRQPQLELFSTPAMANSSVVSYLIFGRAPGSSPGEGQILAQAAAALSARGGNFLTRDIADTLGVEIRFDAGDDLDDTAVTIGRYLAPGLYVSYGIGLFEAVNTFNLRYEVNRFLTLESTTSPAGSSADLLYTIER